LFSRVEKFNEGMKIEMSPSGYSLKIVLFLK